jgi:hypothetical protein
MNTLAVSVHLQADTRSHAGDSDEHCPPPFEFIFEWSSVQGLGYRLDDIEVRGSTPGGARTIFLHNNFQTPWSHQGQCSQDNNDICAWAKTVFWNNKAKCLKLVQRRNRTGSVLGPPSKPSSCVKCMAGTVILTHLTKETELVSETLCFLVCRIPDYGQSLENQ